MTKKTFYGWWITAAAICTFGIAVGIPYYNMPFFYDYYEKSVAQGGFGWSREQITLGFPLAAVFTLWVGPIVMHRFSPRKLIMAGRARVGTDVLVKPATLLDSSTAQGVRRRQTS